MPPRTARPAAGELDHRLVVARTVGSGAPRSSRSTRSQPGRARRNRAGLSDAEVTDIIPFNEFGNLHELEFRENSAFDTDYRVMRAPELDDLSDEHEKPLRLAIPVAMRTDVVKQHDGREHRFNSHGVQVVVGSPALVSSVHRGPPTGGAGSLKCRFLIAAMATGAAAAGATHWAAKFDSHSSPTILAADASTQGSAGPPAGGRVQVIVAAPAVSAEVIAEEFAKGKAFAQARAEREARLQRPLYVLPAQGTPTSAFGYRWGALHSGIDIANTTGTPIYAVADGVVIAAGPTAGFGMWVKLRHADGTVTLYGHVDTATVAPGEQVMAGDQIATMGNRGNSTGPHLHFEVHLGGAHRVDPVPWLRQRGLSVGGFAG